ncbi:MAG: hypothetical protein QG629_95 [Patescibacteria group bacterium]|nr:DUF4234 domain-containing protein [Candidatus Saccharibacteria bacterium]MDQ5963013.1 hypothetical protein [Patescibacteria group bacterium]
MKQRSVTSVVLLTIFTLGIYSLFWLYYTKKDLTRLGYKIPSMWMLFAPMLTIFALFLIAGAVGAFDTSFTSASNYSAVYAVLMLCVIPLYFFATFYPLYWYYQYCKAASLATQGRAALDNGYALYLASWLLGIILPWWVGYMQDAYNKTATGQGGSPSTNRVGSWTNPHTSGPQTTYTTTQHSGPIEIKASKHPKNSSRG